MSTPSKGKVFVAGASGAIGRRLCVLLVKDGWKVFGTTRFEQKRSLLQGIGVSPVIVDVFDEALLLKAIEQIKPDIVIHQLTDLPPALDPAKMSQGRVNNARIREVGTRNLVSAVIATGVKRMIAQSVAFVYAPGLMPFREESPLNVNNPDFALTAKAVSSLEQQVLCGSFEGIVLRYGKLYGSGTGFDQPPAGGALHVDAAADAARRAITYGKSGMYNVAEEDGTVSSQKAISQLGWNPAFRIVEH